MTVEEKDEEKKMAMLNVEFRKWTEEESFEIEIVIM